MAFINPLTFFRQVRQEVSKVTWPTRKETTVSTGMVMVMVVLASVFFLLVDQFFAWAVRMIFGLGV
jgi:preprotein translocase subunit SecE